VVLGAWRPELHVGPRLGETGWRLFDLEYGRGLPYDLREGTAPNESSFYVLEDSWSTKGARSCPSELL